MPPPDPFKPTRPLPPDGSFLPAERQGIAPTIWEPSPEQIAHVTRVYPRMERWPRYRVENPSYQLWTEVFVGSVPRADRPRFVLGEVAGKLCLRWETEWIVERLRRLGAMGDQKGGQIDLAVVEAVPNLSHPWKFAVWGGRFELDRPPGICGARAIDFSQIYGLRASAIDPEWEDVIRLLGLIRP